MIGNIRIGVRLHLIAIVLLAALGVVSLSALHEIHDRLMAERQSQIEFMVHGAISQIARYEGLSRTGALSEDEAKRQALNVIDSLRYSDDGYVWINDTRPVILSHPNAAMVGRNVAEILDSDGRSLFHEFLRISAGESGKGVVAYKWPKPGEETPLLKISYVERFKAWDWVVGSGVYVDDIDAAYLAAAQRFGLFALAAAAIGGMIIWFVGASITGPLSRITQRMGDLSVGKDVDVPESDRGDEIGDLMQAMRAFKRHLAEKEQFRDAHDAVLREAGTVFNVISDAVMVTDTLNHIKLVNPAFTRITGYGPDEVIGREPGILASGRHDATFYRLMWDQLRAEGHWSGEVWNRAKNGEIYPEWLSITAIRDRDGVEQGYVATFNNISERKRHENRIRWQAEHDALTGLVNRRHFETSLTVAIHAAGESEEELALLFIDLDGFKAVNDQLGHSAGDKVLTLVAKRLHEIVRAGDLVARLGGDEFVIVIPSLHRKHDAISIAEKIVTILAEPIPVGDKVAEIGASVGIAIYPHHGTCPESLMAAADAAMYQRKQAGRNGIRMAESVPLMGDEMI